MTYFHLECGEEGRPLKILGCFTAGRGPRLFNQASPLSGVKSRRQEMTTRAGLQPFSWAIVALAPSWALTQGPSPVLRPTGRMCQPLQVTGRKPSSGQCQEWVSVLGLFSGPAVCPPSPLRTPCHTAHPCKASFRRSALVCKETALGELVPDPLSIREQCKPARSWEIGPWALGDQGAYNFTHRFHSGLWPVVGT